MTTLLESQFLDKLLSDKQKLKQLAIAWRHDSTIDPELVATLGPKMTDEEIARRWSAMLDQKLNNLGEPEMLTDPKYKDWMTKLYTTGVHHSSQITNRLPSLEGWHLLSVRGLLKPEHTDLNRFRSADILQRIIDREYLSKLEQIKRERELEKLKKDIREIVLIDDKQFRVAIPLNYAACYRFNYTGHNSRYCTGASDGRSFFANYSYNGPIVTVIDKKNVNKADGKWQLHAASSQIANSTQQIAGASADRKFAQLYPGLLKQILAAIQAKSEEIRTASIPLVGDERGYDMPKVIKSFAKQFPNSFKSEPLDEQTLLESSTVLTQFKDLPSAEKMILPMHKAGRLPHDTKLFNTTKLDVKRLRDKIRNGEGVSFVIFVRGTKDLGILTMGVYTNSAYVYQGSILVKQEGKSIAELITWLKTHIGKIVEYSIAQSPSVAVQRVKVKRERLKPLPQTTAPIDIATTFINKLKPLVVRNLERAVADIKGYVNTLIKSSNYDRAANKIAILKQLEKKLEDIEATGNYDDTYIMSKMLNAIHAAALYHYPEHGEQGFQDRPTTVYPGFRSSGSVTYTPLRDTTGVKQLMTDIARGDVKKVGTVLAFFRDELVKPL